MVKGVFSATRAIAEAQRLEALAAETDKAALRDEYLRLAQKWRLYASESEAVRATLAPPPLEPGAYTPTPH